MASLLAADPAGALPGDSAQTKPTQEAKGKRDALEDEIKSIDGQIEKLKQAADKLARIGQKIEELMPRLLAALGSDENARRMPTPSTAKSGAFAAVLENELPKSGLRMSGDEIRKISDAIAKGGGAGYHQQTQERLLEINKEIDSLGHQKKTIQEQIKDAGLIRPGPTPTRP